MVLSKTFLAVNSPVDGECSRQVGTQKVSEVETVLINQCKCGPEIVH